MSSSASAVCITHTSAFQTSRLTWPTSPGHRALWTAFPSSDYYWASVAVGLSPGRQSRVFDVVDVQVGSGASFMSLTVATGDLAPQSVFCQPKTPAGDRGAVDVNRIMPFHAGPF